jgi:hypothetical protein
MPMYGGTITVLAPLVPPRITVRSDTLLFLNSSRKAPTGLAMIRIR